jgi:hypothetical protein
MGRLVLRDAGMTETRQGGAPFRRNNKNSGLKIRSFGRSVSRFLQIGDLKQRVAPG